MPKKLKKRKKSLTTYLPTYLRNQDRVIFLAGTALFVLSIVLVLLGVSLPSPVPNPAGQVSGFSYFLPFLNWLTIISLIIASIGGVGVEQIKTKLGLAGR